MSPLGEAATDTLDDWRSFWLAKEAPPRELFAALLTAAIELAHDFELDRDTFLKACERGWTELNETVNTTEDNSPEGNSDTWQN